MHHGSKAPQVHHGNKALRFHHGNKVLQLHPGNRVRGTLTILGSMLLHSQPHLIMLVSHPESACSRSQALGRDMQFPHQASGRRHSGLQCDFTI